MSNDNIASEYMQIDVAGYEGVYAVDTNGKIFSYPKLSLRGRHYLSFRCLKTKITRCGYEQVSLRLNNKNKFLYIHRLVALAFVPNPQNKSCVNHIDGNKQNNHVSNLEWCTASENQKHAYKIGLKLPSMRDNYPTGAEHCLSKKVRCIETGIIYDSAKIASESLGLFRQQVSTAINRNGCAGGFHWEYYNPTECVLKVGDEIHFYNDLKYSITEINHIESKFYLGESKSITFYFGENHKIKSVNGKKYDTIIIPKFDFAQCLVDAGFTLDGDGELYATGSSWNESIICLEKKDDRQWFLSSSSNLTEATPANAQIIVSMANLAKGIK